MNNKKKEQKLFCVTQIVKKRISNHVVLCNYEKIADTKIWDKIFLPNEQVEETNSNTTSAIKTNTDAATKKIKTNTDVTTRTIKTNTDLVFSIFILSKWSKNWKEKVIQNYTNILIGLYEIVNKDENENYWLENTSTILLFQDEIHLIVNCLLDLVQKEDTSKPEEIIKILEISRLVDEKIESENIKTLDDIFNEENNFQKIENAIKFLLGFVKIYKQNSNTQLFLESNEESIEVEIKKENTNLKKEDITELFQNNIKKYGIDKFEGSIAEIIKQLTENREKVDELNSKEIDSSNLINKESIEEINDNLKSILVEVQNNSENSISISSQNELIEKLSTKNNFDDNFINRITDNTVDGIVEKLPTIFNEEETNTTENQNKMFSIEQLEEILNKNQNEVFSIEQLEEILNKNQNKLLEFISNNKETNNNINEKTLSDFIINELSNKSFIQNQIEEYINTRIEKTEEVINKMITVNKDMNKDISILIGLINNALEEEK